MKTAGDILSSLFDEGFVKKAQGYTTIFNSWEDITAKNEIAAAAAHSRIKELEKGVLLIEMDHPGWKQILQTKQSKLLSDFRFRFPDMNISAISLMLGKSGGEPKSEAEEKAAAPVYQEEPEETQEKSFAVQEPSCGIDYSAIKNGVLREKLIKLGQIVSERKEE